jgi:putative DNA primase/helicase
MGTEPSYDYDPRPPAFSDEALALRFAEVHVRDLRFVAEWNTWLRWDGRHWEFDRTLFALNEARKVCRNAAAMCGGSRAATVLASRKTVMAVEALARADRRLAASATQWDADPWLLNTPSGIIDLRTGVSRKQQAEDYTTHLTAVAPEGDCPTFKAFLSRAMNGSSGMVRFIQRILGYALTGITREHAVFFMHGQGANGKSVLLSTVGKILGSYHATAPIETFTGSNEDRHPTELARLKGVRLVTAVETEEGRRWSESRIKVLTGGDPVAARFMRQNYFEYTPQFKLVIAGNHRPGLRSINEAIRRRFHLIPFDVTIPPQERDYELASKLEAELPGILAWMLQGCFWWRILRLTPPEAVLTATAAYLEAEDLVSAWIEQACIRDPAAWASSTDLFRAWCAWAATNGEFAGSMKRFAQQLETRGFVPARKACGRGFQGFKLLP